MTTDKSPPGVPARRRESARALAGAPLTPRTAPPNGAAVHTIASGRRRRPAPPWSAAARSRYPRRPDAQPAEELAGVKRIESELTQWRVFLRVKPSPIKTWPRWPSQLAQTISVRWPSGSGTRLTAPGISSSKLGQPQPEWNLLWEEYSSAPQRRQV